MSQYVSNMSSSPSSSSSSPATDPEDADRRHRRTGSMATATVAVAVSVATVATSVRSGSDLWQTADCPQPHGWWWSWCCCWPCDTDRRYCTGGGTITSSRNTCARRHNNKSIIILLLCYIYILLLSFYYSLCISIATSRLMFNDAMPLIVQNFDIFVGLSLRYSSYLNLSQHLLFFICVKFLQTGHVPIIYYILWSQWPSKIRSFKNIYYTICDPTNITFRGIRKKENI